ncbi:MAG: NADAR family protein [Clostridia bacterium]|nr:NADAR family protein [Clostridia bacterium]
MTVINDFREENAFLSNFYSHPFKYKGLVYKNAEAAFQAQKCATDEEKIKYTEITNPVVAKRMGKKEPGFPSDWDEICYGIMKDILICKFAVPELREKLLATGDAELIEGNRWHDNRWGSCTCERCSKKEGLNWLGKILMEIRNEIYNQVKKSV